MKAASTFHVKLHLTEDKCLLRLHRVTQKAQFLANLKQFSRRTGILMQYGICNLQCHPGALSILSLDFYVRQLAEAGRSFQP